MLQLIQTISPRKQFCQTTNMVFPYKWNMTACKRPKGPQSSTTETQTLKKDIKHVCDYTDAI